ncbi:OPT family small oligopeptide transporter [Phakopsora pachyrhizi]|uniref:OPT family small oligopeptide transporter n=1 Tax=Phakopsora pachyrhizi TaxID=170000 RepID=A0AAV0AY43_PHAPC|nr:OPT family small oligopeptide transporter [Phakopsora pachyrhizi]
MGREDNYSKVETKSDYRETLEDEEGEEEGDILLNKLNAQSSVEDSITNARYRNLSSPGSVSESLIRSGKRDSIENSNRNIRDDDGDDDLKFDDEFDKLATRTIPETDDPTMTTSTIRVWLIGGSLGGFGAGINQIFFFKSNGIGFGGFFIVLVSYPLGKLMAAVVPNRIIWIPNPLGAFSTMSHISKWLYPVRLNPGPFSLKEHLLIGVLAGCASSAAYAGDIVAVQDLYYHQEMDHFGSLLLILSTQLLGFGLAGLTYSILIRPTKMVWPSSLVTVTLYNTLHGIAGDGEESQRFMKDRMRFFSIVFILIFIYQFLPSVIAPTLTSISILCIINNRDALMRVLGSGYTGAGLLTFSLDWTVIGSAGSLFTPFFASLNFFSGMIFSMWILVPVLWYSNFWDYQSFGDNAVSAKLFDKNFAKYNVTAVVKPDFTLDEDKSLGPIQLTPFFAISYGISFAVLTSAIVTVYLFHSDDIKSAISERHKASSDVHVEILERNYENVPGRWYLWIGGSMFIASIYVVLIYPLQCPVWALLLALGMVCFFVKDVYIPFTGEIKATTNTQIGLNVITEFVAGILLPGKPMANITFKVYGYMTMSQCLDLASDLKLGIYAKIPPKDMFLFQVSGTTIGAIINYIFIRSVISNKRDMLDGTVIDPTGQWTGRKPEIFYSASVIWGLIGPVKFFSGKYKILYWGFPIGAILPFIPWLLHKRYPIKSFWKRFSIPLFLFGSISPPQLPTNIIAVGLLSAFLSQYWALRYKTKWFEKYNYVLSSALDAGSSLNALTIYLLGLKAIHSWWNPETDSEHCKSGT